jgi:hypothetical protein
MRNEWFCSWRHYIDQLCVKTNNRDSPNPQPGMISWRCHEMKSNGDWIGWTNLNEDLLGFNVVSYFSAIYKPLHGHKQQLNQLYIYIYIRGYSRPGTMEGGSRITKCAMTEKKITKPMHLWTSQSISDLGHLGLVPFSDCSRVMKDPKSRRE